jgi:hypothetical protein
VTQRIGISGHRFRIFLANLAIASGWVLKGSCEACAHWLFALARWLVPEAQRFLVLRTDSHDQHRRILKFAANLSTLSSQIVPLKVVAGALIVLALLGSLELVTRATAITAQSKLSELTQEPAPVSGMKSAVIPLPTRNPQGAYRISSETGSIPPTKKRIDQQKRARHKPRR